MEKQRLNTEIGMLGNTNTGKFLSTISTSLSQIARDSLNASRSQGVDGSVRAAQGTARGQETGLHAQLTNMRLNLGITLLPTYVSLLRKANAVLDRFNGFVRAHPRLTRAATMGILATTGALAAAVPVLFVAGTALSAYGNLTAIAARRTALLEAAQMKNTAATIMGAEAQAGANLASAGRARALLGLLNPFRLLRVVGVGALRAVGGALMFLVSPVGLVTGALVVGGFLIWKYWRPIAAFLTGFGQGLAEAFRPARPLFTRLAAWIKPVVTLFENLLTPVQDTGSGFRGATEAGMRFGRTVGGIIQWVIDRIGALISGIGTVGNALIHPVASIERLFGGGQQPAYTDLPNFRQPGGGAQGGDVTHNHTYNITQQPGESSAELAQRIHRLTRQNSRPAPALADGPDGVMR